jgi:hypothetical protein
VTASLGTVGKPLTHGTSFWIDSRIGWGSLAISNRWPWYGKQSSHFFLGPFLVRQNALEQNYCCFRRERRYKAESDALPGLRKRVTVITYLTPNTL